MGSVLGELLPLAVGVALSPVPIIAVILMLFAPRAGGTSAGFLLGWVAGIVVAVVVFVFVARTTDLGSASHPSTRQSWIKLLVGVALLVLAARQWRSRPGLGENGTLPKWMSAIDSITPVKAIGLGFLLSAINPKNLAMCIAAAVAIVGAGLAGADIALAILIFTIIAACTVAIPAIAFAVAPAKMRGPLDQLKARLQTSNAAIMTALLLVIGALLIGEGLGGLL